MGPAGSDDYRALLKSVASPKCHFVLFSPIGELEDDLASRQQPAPPTLSGLRKLEPIAVNLVGTLFTPDLERPVREQDERRARADRKSTRLNSSHSQISYAVFCLKKKKKKTLGTCSSRPPPQLHRHDAT